MALNEVKVKTGAEFVFGTGASFNPADNGTNMSNTDAIDHEMALSALPAGGARQSIKMDLGATRPARYSVAAAFNFTGKTPVSGESVDLYWAPSHSSTQANGNVAGNSGADDAAGAGAVPSAITAAEFVKQCQFIGSFIITDDITVQCGHVGIFSPAQRHGQMICHNNTTDPFEADDIEPHIVMTEIIDEIQAAA